MAAPARRLRDHDAVDIDKTRIAGAEPLEIGTRVVGILIHREHRGVQHSDPAYNEGLSDQMLQSLRREPGQFPRMRVVQREQSVAEWRGRRDRIQGQIFDENRLAHIFKQKTRGPPLIQGQARVL